jgi:1,4-dihydroxy-2-naphthoyl-CoA synthase
MNHRSLAPPEESMADVHTYEDVEGTRAFGEKRPADFGQFVTA